MLYQQIARNKRNTWIVLILFALLVVAVTVFLWRTVSAYLGGAFLLFGLLYFLYHYYQCTRQLMQVTNARRLTKEEAPALFEIVEELCLAGGLPMPKLYLDPDPLPNAYATGRDPEHASLALTQGLVDIMNRQEIAGVVGHELSHIRNHDSQVTVIVGIILQFIVGFAISGTLFCWGIVISDLRGVIGLVIRLFALVGGLIFLGLLVVAIPLGKIMYFALSRQREYLADAGSVELTREPSGLISALEKLKDPQLQMEPAKNMALNGLYLNGPKPHYLWDRLFSDHPALDKRIARLKNSAAS